MNINNKITKICFVPAWLTFSYQKKYGNLNSTIFQGTFYKLMRIIQTLPTNKNIVIEIFSPISIYEVLRKDLLALEDKIISVNHIG